MNASPVDTEELLSVFGDLDLRDLSQLEQIETPGETLLAMHGDQLITLMPRDGTVRVGPATGEEPHVLIGHEGPIWGVRVDPSGRLVASTSEDGTVRIWPMPDGRPLHTLPRDALLDKLRSLTNLRIVADAAASTGYRTTFLPFQGWDRNPPTW